MPQVKTTQRKKHSAAFKAKVGLEALKGIKTVGQIARDYEFHPVQLTQWKKGIRERLGELFETPSNKEAIEQSELVSALHEKIGQLTVEIDWLKKKSKQLGL